MPGLGQVAMDGRVDMTVDLNADLGEISGSFGEALDAALLDIVSSASVASGGHAGDQASMERVCRIASENGVRVGAHLSFDDRAGFGRRVPDHIDAALTSTLTRQLAMLIAAAERAGTHLSYVKPHGALYNLALEDEQVAAALLDALRDSDLPVLTIQDSTLASMASASGRATYGEFFADRGYLPTGRLVPRDVEGALLHDGVADRVLRAVATKSVVAVDGTQIPVQIDSVCVHSDSPDAVRMAASIRRRLEDSGLRIHSFAD